MIWEAKESQSIVEEKERMKGAIRKSAAADSDSGIGS